MPKRHVRSRRKGDRLPAGVVCVTRPGKWGNPFATADAFRKVLLWHLDNPDYLAACETDEHMQRMARDIEELRGKDLACWCKIGNPCHADVLIEFANPEGVTR